ncbi:uncharacterized protein LOC117321086 [Pecten maximus]|uniref:uncharacterized protein LOC117321086 n=1 Tax=Pecten maximus TaxID=6579 RepID=UPI0014588DCD|nr:uncharacterized protein LOC117321086 [Pecten maximus]
MAFRTTYHNILSHDLRNIHAGNVDSRIIRSPSNLPIISPYVHACTTTSQRRNRALEYNYEHRLYVPRAPAFEVLSKERINDMVNRMHRPKTSHAYSDDARSEYDSDSTLNRHVTSLSAADIKSCSERLANQQTVATKVRKCLTGSIRSKSATPDIRSSCPRMTMSISQRYYPRAYKRWYASQST